MRKTSFLRLKLNFVVVLFGLSAFYSCSIINTPSFDRIRPWSQSLQNEYPAVPFVYKYQKNNKKVIFLAADHSKEITSPTHKLVDDLVNSEQFNLIVIEGVKTAKGENYSKVVEYFEANMDKLNEGSYAAKLGYYKKIPFIGGEADSLDIKDQIVRSDISIKDFVTFLLLRCMASFNRSNPDLSLTKALNKCYSHLEEEYLLSRQELVHEKEFLLRSENLLGRKFGYSTLSTIDVAPICDLHATKAQLINCQVNKIRNKHLVSLIHQSLQKYDNILVVYGAGHLVQIDLSLRSFMDKI